MTPQLETVLQISAIGTGLLFAALAGLIGLMYLLTAQWLFKPAAEPAEAAPEAVDDVPDEEETDVEDEEEAERERQRRAVAIAVALACAQAERPAVLVTSAGTDWRRLHHTRRLNQPRSRTRTRR